jgi:hypothetical protein
MKTRGLALFGFAGVAFSLVRAACGSDDSPSDLPFGRSGIEVCVAVSPSATPAVDPGRAAELVKTAAASAIGTDKGKDLRLGQLDLTVAAGCPDGYVDPPADVLSGAASVKGKVEQPLRTSTLVFVTDDQQAARLGPSGFARAAYESVCEGEVCSEVTTALFVSRGVLESKDTLETAMLVGLGIDLTGGRYPNGHPP